MHADTVFTRSERARDELATRRHGLDAAARVLLAQVDGRKRVHELAQRFAGMLDAPRTLARLYDEGYLTHASGPEPAPVPPPVAAARPTLAARLLDRVRALAEAAEQADQAADVAAAAEAERRARAARATHLLADLLGPDGDRFGLRLERARDEDEFEAALAQCARVIEGLRGAAAAAAFLRAVDRSATA